MDINIDDNISNDYLNRWMGEDLDYYFKYLNLQYDRLEFINYKESIILKKNPSITKQELHRKIELALNRKFKKRMSQLFN